LLKTKFKKSEVAFVLQDAQNSGPQKGAKMAPLGSPGPQGQNATTQLGAPTDASLRDAFVGTPHDGLRQSHRPTADFLLSGTVAQVWNHSLHYVTFANYSSEDY